ncbi:MAG: nucleotidyl transferase AbiEii/AbiGii toxin family protein [Prosthecobacter sp.]|nr:nucleotidyl transferase AbiEii/AbiGii toxin family protein [Prosthecobacter sp.]
MSSDSLPPWDEVLSAATRLQQIVPHAVLVGGTAAAVHAQHRFSRDADHVIPDLRQRFDEILTELESVAGWRTARVNRPVLILGSLDGIETGIRQLIREAPLETQEIAVAGETLRLPTPAEMLRIKAVLILRRNATRDYVDLVALADHLGLPAAVEALRSFDTLYPQPSGESPLQQLAIQLATPQPFDLEGTNLAEYKNLAPCWHDWNAVATVCMELAARVLDEILDPQET